MFAHRTATAIARRAVVNCVAPSRCQATTQTRSLSTTKTVCLRLTQAPYADSKKSMTAARTPAPSSTTGSTTTPSTKSSTAVSEESTMKASSGKHTSEQAMQEAGEGEKDAKDNTSGVPSSSSDPNVYVYKRLHEIKSIDDLIGPGALPGTVPTDIEQATGVERMELLAKLEGQDLWDMKPLDSSRVGTLDDPIMVKSGGQEQYLGCTGCPAGSHNVKWLTISRDRPIERCIECGSVYKMEYIGDPHEPIEESWEPKSFADYIKPEYLYR